MSQPPQNGWGQSPSGDPYGQSSPNGGYGDMSQQPAYGQPSADGSYGQPSPNSGYGQDPSFAPAFGEDTAGQTGEGGGKNNSKIAIFACIGCAILIILALVVGGGIWLFSRGGDDTGSEDTQTTQEEGADEGADGGTDEGDDTGTDEGGTDEGSDEGGEEPTTDEPTTDESPDAAPASGDTGTRDNPIALGETFTVNDGEGGTLDVTLGEINWDATSAIMEANQFNDPPAEGQTYVIVPVTVVYHGSGSFEPGFSLSIEYVSNAGNSYEETFVSHDNQAYDVGALYDGGSGSWDIVLAVPTDQVQDGAFNVSVLWNFDDDPVWVAAT